MVVVPSQRHKSQFATPDTVVVHPAPVDGRGVKMMVSTGDRSTTAESMRMTAFWRPRIGFMGAPLGGVGAGVGGEDAPWPPPIGDPPTVVDTAMGKGWLPLTTGAVCPDAGGPIGEAATGIRAVERRRRVNRSIVQMRGNTRVKDGQLSSMPRSQMGRIRCESPRRRGAKSARCLI